MHAVSGKGSGLIKGAVPHQSERGNTRGMEMSLLDTGLSLLSAQTTAVRQLWGRGRESHRRRWKRRRRRRRRTSRRGRNRKLSWWLERGGKVTNSDCHSAHSLAGWRSGIASSEPAYECRSGPANKLSLSVRVETWTRGFCSFFFVLFFSPLDVTCCFGSSERFAGKSFYTLFVW